MYIVASDMCTTEVYHYRAYSKVGTHMAPPMADACTWASGCCSRHPNAAGCRSSAVDVRPNRLLAVTTPENPLERERGVLALRQQAEMRAQLERRNQPSQPGELFYWSTRSLNRTLPSGCRRLREADADRSRPRPLPPLQIRTDLGALLQAERKAIGVEVGVKKGRFAHSILGAWSSCRSYTLVDLWQTQRNYRDRANVDGAQQDRNYRITMRRLEPYAAHLSVCRNFSVECARRLAEESMDFVYSAVLRLELASSATLLSCVASASSQTEDCRSSRADTQSTRATTTTA